MQRLWPLEPSDSSLPGPKDVPARAEASCCVTSSQGSIVLGAPLWLLIAACVAEVVGVGVMLGSDVGGAWLAVCPPELLHPLSRAAMMAVAPNIWTDFMVSPCQ